LVRADRPAYRNGPGCRRAAQASLFFVVAAVVVLLLVGWVVIAIAHRPKSPEHDLRRRALAIVAGFGAVASPGVALLSQPVAIVVIVACALVVPAGLSTPPTPGRARPAATIASTSFTMDGES
jgi:hypothetical protein